MKKLLLTFLLLAACRKAQSPPVSKGFQPAATGPLQISPAEQDKLRRVAAMHFPERHVKEGALDLYVNEKLQRSVPAAEMNEARPLASLVGTARSVLAH